MRLITEIPVSPSVVYVNMEFSSFVVNTENFCIPIVIFPGKFILIRVQFFGRNFFAKVATKYFHERVILSESA